MTDSTAPDFSPVSGLSTSLRDIAISVAAASNAPLAAPERWVLVDIFDAGDRRYFVGRLAEPGAGKRRRLRPESERLPISTRDLRVLAKRAQGQSVKVIAIETRLSSSTVSTILKRLNQRVTLRAAKAITVE